MSAARPPHRAQPGRTGAGQPAGAVLRVAGRQVRFTVGALILAVIAAVVSALSLPATAPDRPAWAYVAAAVVIAVGVLGSLGAHDAGHALAGRARRGTRRQPVRALTIGFAGSSHAPEPAASVPASPAALGRAAASGPLASLIVALAAGAAAAGLAFTGADELVMIVLAVLAVLNGGIMVLSLLPGAGADGTRLLRALAWARSGDSTRAALMAARGGQWTGAALMLAGLVLVVAGVLAGLWVALIGILAFTSSRSEVRRLAVVSALGGLLVREIAGTARGSLPAWQTVAEFIAARQTPDGRSEAAGPSDDSADRAAPADHATAVALHAFDGSAAGVVTLSQVAAVPVERRADTRLRDVATPVAQLMTTTADEPLARLLQRMPVWPASPAAAHTLGHALILAADGSPAGVLTPADFGRATQFGWLHRADHRPGGPGPAGRKAA